MLADYHDEWCDGQVQFIGRVSHEVLAFIPNTAKKSD
jgi:hypothetical protein